MNFPLKVVVLSVLGCMLATLVWAGTFDWSGVYSYADGKMENSYGVKIYDAGEWLFTLKRAGHGSQDSLLTYWGSLGKNTQIFDGKVCFRKMPHPL